MKTVLKTKSIFYMTKIFSNLMVKNTYPPKLALFDPYDSLLIWTNSAGATLHCKVKQEFAIIGCLNRMKGVTI